MALYSSPWKLGNSSPVSTQRCVLFYFSLPCFADFLSGSKFSDDVKIIQKCFDETTKLRFGETEETQYIAFGSYRDNEQEFNIRNGRLKLTWWETIRHFNNVQTTKDLSPTIHRQQVASFYEPSITCIVKSVKEQRDFALQRLSVSLLRI